MQIFVKALSGTRTVTIDASTNVDQLKQRIEELEGKQYLLSKSNFYCQ